MLGQERLERSDAAGDVRPARVGAGEFDRAPGAVAELGLRRGGFGVAVVVVAVGELDEPGAPVGPLVA